MEKELIRRLGQGDREAFGEIYQMYARAMLSVALKHVKPAEDAEELVQDVFIALWRNRENIKNTDTLRPLLFTALRNRIVNFHRSRINSPVFADYLELTANNTPSDDAPRIEYEEFRRFVFIYIKRLPPTQQKVVTLSRFQGLAAADIAKQLNLSVQTVKNALSSGLKQLREMISNSNYGK